MSSADDDNQQLWLWVAQPKYTQDQADDTRDRPDMADLGWWTCHEDTHPGDLALPYVTARFSEVRWLVCTDSDELIDVRNDAVAQAEGWEWGTAFTVLARFDATVTFSEMRETQTLQNRTGMRLRGSFMARRARGRCRGSIGRSSRGGL